MDRAYTEVVRLAAELSSRRRREADEALRADGAPSLLERRILLADVDAVGAGPLHERGPVVEDEEGAVLGTRAPEGLRRAHEVVGRQLLVAELDDVDAAAKGSIEERRRIAAVRTRLEHEIEPRAGEAGASRGAVHGGGPYRPRRGAIRRSDRRR